MNQGVRNLFWILLGTMFVIPAAWAGNTVGVCEIQTMPAVLNNNPLVSHIYNFAYGSLPQCEMQLPSFCRKEVALDAIRQVLSPFEGPQSPNLLITFNKLYSSKVRYVCIPMNQNDQDKIRDRVKSLPENGWSGWEQPAPEAVYPQGSVKPGPAAPPAARADRFHAPQVAPIGFSLSSIQEDLNHLIHVVTSRASFTVILSVLGVLLAFGILKGAETLGSAGTLTLEPVSAIAAIAAIVFIMSDANLLTPDELNRYRKYSGWGGLSEQVDKLHDHGIQTFRYNSSQDLKFNPETLKASFVSREKNAVCKKTRIDGGILPGC